MPFSRMDLDDFFIVIIGIRKLTFARNQSKQGESISFAFYCHVAAAAASLPSSYRVGKSRKRQTKSHAFFSPLNS
jgi:hypothetical protein